MRRLPKTLLLCAALFLLNAWIVKELFRTEFVVHMFSIEGAYIGLARYVAANWRDLTWFPFWYGGQPYQNTYLPLLHLIVAAVSKLLGLAPGLAYHATAATFYCLGPVALFLLAKEVSKSRAYGFAAALLYSLISPSTFLIYPVRGDAGGLWHARRLQTMVFYGEGPHVSSMTFFTVALLLLVLAFRKRRPVWWVLAALSMAVVAITNWVGATGLAAAVPAWLFATGDRPFGKKWITAACVALYGYAIACCWIPPSSVINTRSNEMVLMGHVSPDTERVLWAGAIAWAFFTAGAFLRRRNVPEELRFAVLFLIPMAGITLGAEWFRILLVPQAPRCHLEMEMAIVLALAFGAKWALGRLQPRARVALACVLMIFAVYPALKYRRYSKSIVRAIDIQRSIEYREAHWFEANMPGWRVMPSGSVGFFLSAFADVPQLGGGFEQGCINLMNPAFRYQITSGDNAGAKEGEVAIMGLRAFGVGAVAVSGPRSQEAFKPFRNPKKFDGLLPEAWRDGDDVIYRIPSRSDSLAHVIRRGDLPTRAPIHGLDIDPIRGYVAALEDPALPLAGFQWTSRHSAVIHAPLHRDQLVSVQESYHRGWHASVNGSPRKMFRDPMGQMAIEPECEGECTIELNYDGGTEMLIARLISWSSLFGGLVWIVLSTVRTRRRES